MANSSLIKFIVEARRRGFDDYEIRSPLIKNGWSPEDVSEAFESLRPRSKGKIKYQIYLDSEVSRIVEKRADKNMFSPEEQIEDIVRRSAVNQKHPVAKEKLDDLFLTFFSRKRR